MEGSDIDFQKAEIVENLHRAELTVQQRAEWRTELVRLCAEEEAAAAQKKIEKTGPLFAIEPKRVAQVGPPVQKRGHRQERHGVRQAARELGQPRTNIQRDLKIAATSPEAKEAARAAGLDDNQSALLKIAAEPTLEAQVAKVAEIVERQLEPGDAERGRAPLPLR